jgi:cytochrome c553
MVEVLVLAVERVLVVCVSLLAAAAAGADGDTDEPDWGSHHDDTNTDPDYEPFDGEQIFDECTVCLCVSACGACHGEVHTWFFFNMF